MKHSTLFSKTAALLVALLTLALPARADRVVKQLQFGKQTIEVAADEVITFQDMNGNTGISSSNSSNSQSLTVFKPAAGMAIQITFSSLDVRNDGTNYPAYVNVYAGDPDPDGTFAYATTTSGVTASSTLPEGTVLERLDGTYTDKTYTATDASGIIAVGYLYKYAKRIDGWNATVRCITLSDMTVTGAGSDYDQVVAATEATEGVTFAGLHVSTTGVMNADTLTGIRFGVPTNDSAIDPMSLRLYKGSQASFKGQNAIAATVSADGDGYLMTLSEPLAEGDNAFCLAGEFLAEAQPGARAMVVVTGVTTTAHPDGVTPFASGTPLAVTKPAIAMIGTTPQTVIVGDVPYHFYDDGGKDGNITQGFEGQITFVPATEGMAIKIDFSKLDLFNTSTVGYNDVLNFYNGREANADNLIAALLNEPEIVKSTAADGSITVTLKSTAGYPKSGWEALVSQFLPGDMILSGITAQAASTATVAAGESDAQMLVVDVLTDNTSNALHLSSLNLTTTDAKNIARARAYYLGKKNTFATTDPLGQVDVDGNTFAIACDKAMAEGHNYVAVVLDLNDQADTGDEVNLTLASATIGEATVSPEQTATATRRVENICRATKGSHSHNIKSTWTFTNTEGYSGKYEADDADYIVTFTPTEPGTVAEIDFSAFDVYYASSSYGTKAVFEIYSGTEIASSNLLWNLKDASEANVGPGRKLRSQSADGSLTIRFNPKTTSSYYAATGWTATVQPFRNHDMELKQVNVRQTSSDVLAVGASGADLIDFDVVTEGTLSVTTIKAINIDLKGSQAAIDKVSVYYNSENNREGAVEFGSVVNPEAGTVAIAGERVLAEGANYFWLTVDVKADAAAESVIDAKLMSLTDAAGTVTDVADGDPAGERVVKYIYTMQSGNNVVTVTEPLLFYDDGGAEGKLTKGFKGTVTFVPGRDNSAVQINTLSTFSIGSGKMMVYSGREANADNVLGKVTGYGTTTGPENLVSKAADGSLTVVFEANASASTLDGWEMEVSLHEKTPFTIETIEVANTSDPVMRNTIGNAMQQLHLNVSGDKEPIAISEVKFTTTGSTTLSDLTAARVYYTGGSALFSHDGLVGTLASLADGENTLVLDAPVTIADNGDHYLWLAFDVAAEATPGNTVSAQATALTVGGSTMVVAGDAAQRVVRAGLKGNYIIGASDQAHYKTFAEAVTALQGGVEGPVTFQVEDGTYAENLWLTTVPGAGEQNTITFTSLSGNRDAVTLSGAGSSEYLPGSSSYKKGMVYVEQTPAVTIEKMTLAPAQQSEYNYVVQTYDRSHHFTLRDCHVVADPVTSGYSGINLVKTSAVNENGRNNDFGTFERNVLDGGYIALYLGGTNNVGLTRERGLVVRGNVINEAGSKGIYVYDEDDALIEDNIIYQSLVQKTGYWGLDLSRMRGASVVRGNRVTSATTYYSGGIQLRGETFGTPEQPIQVYNNVINITASPSNSSAGIEVDIDQHDIDIAHNTVRIAGQGGYGFYTARRSGATYSGIKLQNNLIQNLTGSPAMFIYGDYSSQPTFTSNAFWGETVLDGTTIDALNSIEGNSGNIAEQANFLSEADLHLLEAGNLNMGTPIAYITTDADGKARSIETPTVGAYEYAEVVEDKPEMAEGYPTVTSVTETGATVNSKWTVGGKLYTMVETVANAPQGAPARAAKAPSADQIKATEGRDIAADTEVAVALTDLQPATSYRAYMLTVSPLGVESDVVETEVFTTLRHIEPLLVEVDDVQTIEAGEEATIQAIVAGGDEPYTYEWRDQMNQVVGNELNLTVVPDYSYAYRLTVTSADGQTATAKTAVRVLGDAVTATIDDNHLDAESHWVHDPSSQNMVNDGFYSGSYYFNTGAMPSYNYWYGYAMSNETATSFASLDDQFHSTVGHGHNGSANYVVAFPEGQFVEVTNSTEGNELKGVYVSNNAYAYNSMAVGDGMATKFEQDSWFAVKAIGFNGNTQTGTVTFYLADYRQANALDHYILDTWQWMDLRPLGKVTKVRFTLDGSDRGTYGLNTAAYFVMDDFDCERDMTEATATVGIGEAAIDLSDYFELAADGSTVTYGIEMPAASPHQGNPAPATSAVELALNADGTLTATSAAPGSAQAIVWATQRGQTQYVQLTVTADEATAINDIAGTGSDVVSVTYVNAAGIESSKPFDGINIVVTRHADGSVTTAKVVK